MIVKLASMIAAIAAIATLAPAASASEAASILPLVRRSTPASVSWKMPLGLSDRIPVTEIEVPDLPDAAMAEMTWAGPVILYNPVLFREAGPAREFVRAHEVAHVLLDHLSNPRMIETDEGRAEAEAEADCFAARSSAKLAVAAMVRLLLRRPAEDCDSIYGTKAERARRILQCAALAPR